MKGGRKMKNFSIAKMKNVSLAALLMASAMFAACSNSDDEILNEQPVNPTEPQTYTMTIQAAKGGDDAATRGLYINGESATSALNANWNGKEKVRVVQDGKVIGTLSAAMSSEHRTTLTGTVTGFEVNHDVGFYMLADEDGKMDYTGQCGALLDDNGTGNIEDNYDFASYELTGAECMEAFKIEGSTVVPKDGVYIPFTSQQAIVWFEFTYNNTPLYAKQLIVTDKNSGKLVQSIDTKTGIKTSSTKTYGPLSLTPVNNTAAGFYVALNLDGASDIHLRVVDSNNKIYTCNKANVTFEKGKYYRVTAEMSPCSVLQLSQITPYDKKLVGWYLAKPLAGEAFAYDPNKISFPGANDYGIIAYVGKVPGYFDNFLAMAMHDIKEDDSERSKFMSWSEALTAIGSYATAHPIVIGSTTYNTASNTAYDEVADNTASASNTSNSTRKGWRIPSVTDWRYIFYGLCGEPCPTNPAGITEGVDYGSSALVTKLNVEQKADLSGKGWYCTSSAVSGANDYRWMIMLSYIPKFEKTSMTYSCLRPVFAY